MLCMHAFWSSNWAAQSKDMHAFWMNLLTAPRARPTGCACVQPLGRAAPHLKMWATRCSRRVPVTWPSGRSKTTQSLVVSSCTTAKANLHPPTTTPSPCMHRSELAGL